MGDRGDRSVAGMLNHYLRERCTLHGFPRCRSDSNTKFRRVFWFIVSVGFSGYCSWQLFVTVRSHYDNPTLTSVKVQHPNSVPFPSVTICPLQTFRTKMFEYIDVERDPFWKTKILPLFGMFLRESFIHHDGFHGFSVPSRDSSKFKENLEILGFNTTSNTVQMALQEFDYLLSERDPYLHLFDLTPLIYRMMNTSENQALQWLLQQGATVRHLGSTIGLSRSRYQKQVSWAARNNKDNGGGSGTFLDTGNLIWNGKYYESGKNFQIEKDDYLLKLLTRNFGNFMLAFDTSYRWKSSAEKNEFSFTQFRADYFEFFELVLTMAHGVENTAEEAALKAINMKWWSRNIEIFAEYYSSFGDDLKRELAIGDTEEAFHVRGLYQVFINLLSIPLPNFVFSCTFQNRNCLQQLSNTIDPRWKSCMHFNSEFLHRDQLADDSFFPSSGRKNRSIPLKVEVAGKEAGLIIRLLPQSSRFQEFLNPSVGFVVAIGDSGTMPRFDQFIEISGDGNTDLAVQRTEINRLDFTSGGNCVDENYLEVAFPDYELLGLYDQNICHLIRRFILVLQECKCIDNNDILGGVIGIRNLTDQYDTCSFLKGPCVDYASELFKSSSMIQDCPPACREIKYDVFFSSMKQEGSNQTLASNIFKNTQRLLKMLSTTEPITLNVFYKTKSVSVMTEVLVSTPTSLIASIGGIAGLYIGMSLVSAVEFIELMVDLIIFKFSKTSKITPRTYLPKEDKEELAPISNTTLSELKQHLKILTKRDHELAIKVETLTKQVHELEMKEENRSEMRSKTETEML